MVYVSKDYDPRAIFQAVLRRSPDWQLAQQQITHASDLQVDYNDNTVSFRVSFSFTNGELDALLSEANATP